MSVLVETYSPIVRQLLCNIIDVVLPPMHFTLIRNFTSTITVQVLTSHYVDILHMYLITDSAPSVVYLLLRYLNWSFCTYQCSKCGDRRHILRLNTGPTLRKLSRSVSSAVDLLRVGAQSSCPGMLVRWLTRVFTLTINPVNYPWTCPCQDLGMENWETLVWLVWFCFACRDESIVCHDLHINVLKNTIPTNLWRNTITAKRIRDEKT